MERFFPKIAILMGICVTGLHGTAPQYLASSFQCMSNAKTNVISMFRGNITTDHTRHYVQHSATVCSLLPLHVPCLERSSALNVICTVNSCFRMTFKDTPIPP